MLRLLELIRIIAPKDVKILIHGKRGTEKELVANAIHEQGHRNKMPEKRPGGRFRKTPG